MQHCRLVAGPGPALAEADWSSLTIDNDTFIGTDNGYTNGIYYSWFDTVEDSKPEPGFLARAMLWSLPEGAKPRTTADIKTIGQAMMAPDDIELEDPPEIADSYRWNRRHAPWRTFSVLSCVLIFGYAADRAGFFCFFRQAPS